MRETRKDTAPVARIPVAARRLPSNSQKLITNLFYGEKGSLIPTTGRRQRKKDLFQKSSHNGTRTRDFSEETTAAATSRRCRRDRYWLFNASYASTLTRILRGNEKQMEIVLVTNLLRCDTRYKQYERENLFHICFAIDDLKCLFIRSICSSKSVT